MKYRLAAPVAVAALLQLLVHAGKLRHLDDPAEATSPELDDVDGVYNDAVKEVRSDITGETGVADGAVKSASAESSNDADVAEDAIVGLSQPDSHRARLFDPHMPKHKPEGFNQLRRQKDEVAEPKPAPTSVDDLASMAAKTDSMIHKFETHETATTNANSLSVDELASMATVTDSWNANMPDVPELKPERDQVEDLTAMVKDFDSAAMQDPRPSAPAATKMDRDAVGDVVKTSGPAGASMAKQRSASKASWAKAGPDQANAEDANMASWPAPAAITPDHNALDDLASMEGALSSKTDRKRSEVRRKHTANVDDLLSFARHMKDGKGSEANANDEMKNKRSMKENKVEVGKGTKTEDVKKVRKSDEEKAKESINNDAKKLAAKIIKGLENDNDNEDEKKEKKKPAGKNDDEKDASKPDKKMGEKIDDGVKDVKKEAKKAEKEDVKKTDEGGEDDDKEPQKPARKDTKETDEAEEEKEEDEVESKKTANEDHERTDDDDDEEDEEEDEGEDVTYSSWQEFLPGCRRKLKSLVAKTEAEYASPQLEGILEAECHLDQQFPAVRDGFFDRRAECKAFAHSLAAARAAERRGERRAYDKCCKRWWDEHDSRGDGEENHHQRQRHFWVCICIATLVAGLIVGIVAHLH
eukprot:TRINITY_DN17_c0_g1_i3.p1 TRINITY_DN17_c0_g1~~TRINITY_DN17_c0_g1_i3.p1  ORF type:complete len:668 (-),score=189.80 TRINITY_DN17_c0_g1_i3:131-2059(-)